MASIRCPECDEKVKLPPGEDRPSVRCSSCGHKIRLDANDPDPPSRRRRDDDDDEGRSARPKKKKRSALQKWGAWANKLDLTLKIIVGLTLIAVLASCAHPVCYLVPMVYGGILMILGSLLFIYTVFSDSPLEFFLCAIVPFYSLYYLVTHWEETKAAFYLQIYGVVVCFMFLCAVPFHLAIFGVRDAVWGKPRPEDKLVQNQPPPNQPPPNQPPPNQPPPNQPPPEQKPPPKLPPAKVTGDVDLDRALENLQSTKRGDQHQGLDALVKMKPNQHRAVVVQRLAVLARDQDTHTRQLVVTALKGWGGRNEVTLFIQFLDDPAIYNRQLALSALGDLPDERAVEPMVRCLVEFQTRYHAGVNLKKMGPVAEAGVAKLLNHNDKLIQFEGIKLLTDIGTRKSVPALQAVVARGDIETKGSAESALKSIAARGR